MPRRTNLYAVRTAPLAVPCTHRPRTSCASLAPGYEPSHDPAPDYISAAVAFRNDRSVAEGDPHQLRGSPSLGELRAYDVGGRAVRELVRAAVAPGSYTARWDGRDDGGRAVAPGVYMARLETARSVDSEHIKRLE